MSIELLLDWVAEYGLLALGLLMLPGALGIPVPASALLVAAGALVRQGIFDWRAMVGIAWLGSVLSDAACFALGRAAGDWSRQRFGNRNQEAWKKAQGRFGRHGGLAVFVTRFLLMSLAIPTNLIAGGAGYSFSRFLAWAGAGKLIWIAVHCGLGYAFASQWRYISETLTRCGSWMLAGTVATAVAVLLVRRVVHRRRRRTASDRPGADACQMMSKQ